ncbi:MAG: hypothetical protein Tsb0034_02120 [Ekhidna sp.]
MSQQGVEILSKLFYSSGEGIMFFGTNGKILTANPRAQQMFGYKEAELTGKEVEHLIPEKFRKNHQKLRGEYVKNPAPRQMGTGRDLEGLRKDGSTFPLEISLSYLQHDNQKMIVAFITDISVRKENEKKLEEQRLKLEEYTTSLERKVKERTSELEHLNLGLQSQIHERKLAEEELKQSLSDLKRAEQEILLSLEKEKELNELKSRFVSMASHEFRTPLTTVLSSANLIGKYTENDQQELREKHISRIKKSVENLTAILNDFLSIEKLESGVIKIEIGSVDVPELLEEVVEEVGLTLKEGQEIQLECPKIVVKSDAHIMKNILINLISNASKYSEKGDPISIVSRKEADYLEIAVKDQGIGIPKAEQKNMFQRFFRAGNVTNIQGTGLGLTIVKRYAELLGGYIDFESEEGKGSTFSLRLPL